MMMSWLRSRGTTVTAILIASMLTVSFGYIAVESFLGALYPDRLDRDFGRGVLSAVPAGSTADAGGAAANASAIIGVVIGAVVLLSAIIIIGLVLRGDWARETGLVIYGLLGLLATGTSMGGLTSDPPAPSAWLGVLTGLANLTVVGLLLAPATARNFKRR